LYSLTLLIPLKALNWQQKTRLIAPSILALEANNGVPKEGKSPFVSP
jgi:hypothetical protein